MDRAMSLSKGEEVILDGNINILDCQKVNSIKNIITRLPRTSSKGISSAVNRVKFTN
jgi:hypothetical protein